MFYHSPTHEEIQVVTSVVQFFFGSSRSDTPFDPSDSFQTYLLTGSFSHEQVNRRRSCGPANDTTIMFIATFDDTKLRLEVVKFLCYNEAVHCLLASVRMKGLSR